MIFVLLCVGKTSELVLKWSRFCIAGAGMISVFPGQGSSASGHLPVGPEGLAIFIGRSRPQPLEVILSKCLELA